MSLLWKDKILQLTLGNGHYHWAFIDKKMIKMGSSSSFVELMEFLKKINVKRVKMEITLFSEICRYATIPALQTWPEQAALDFLMKQQLKKQYPDLDIAQYVLLHDQIKFKMPTVITAVPIKFWNEIEQINAVIKIDSIITDVIKIWNNYEMFLHESSLLVLKQKMAILVHYQNKKIVEINSFPKTMINHIQYDHKFDFSNMEYASKAFVNGFGLEGRLLLPAHLESYITENENQAMNLLGSK
ncbi:hypothetical protein ACG95N_13960 [Acinetobacter guillouiae]|uniref:hypothetical protein n=1 Tax=Acinetobacter guillouiae TaxID=106649 RepID=UPI003AF423E8